MSCEDQKGASDSDDQKLLLEAARSLRAWGWNPGSLLSLMSYMDSRYGHRQTGDVLKSLRSSPLAIFSPYILLQLLYVRAAAARAYLESPADATRSIVVSTSASVRKHAARLARGDEIGDKAKRLLARYAAAIRSVRPSAAEDPDLALFWTAKMQVTEKRRCGQSAKEAWASTARELGWRGRSGPGGEGEALRRWFTRKQKELPSPTSLLVDPATPLNVDWWIERLRRDTTQTGQDISEVPDLSHTSTVPSLPSTNGDRLEQKRGGNARHQDGRSGKKHGSIRHNGRGGTEAPRSAPDAQGLEATRRRSQVCEAEPNALPLRRERSRGLHAGKNVRVDCRGDRASRARRGRMTKAPRKEPPP